MARALEPGVKHYVVLNDDLELPEDKQPRIYYGALPLRKSKRLGSLMDDFAKAANSDELHDRIFAALTEIITGWSNFKHPITGEEIAFSKEAVWDWICSSEAFEIMTKVLQQSTPSAADQKKSE